MSSTDRHSETFKNEQCSSDKGEQDRAEGVANPHTVTGILHIMIV